MHCDNRIVERLNTCPSGIFDSRELRWAAPHGRRSSLNKVRVDLVQSPALEEQIKSKGVCPLLLVIVFEAPASISI